MMLDRIDKEILALLQKNSKLNTKEIAQKVGLSVTPTYERIKKLEKDGVIDKYVAILNKEKLGKSIVSFCNVTLKLHSKPLLSTFESAIANFPEVTECYHIAGVYDYLIKIVTNDIAEYSDFISNKLGALEYIDNVQSSFVLKGIVHRTEINLD